LGIEFWFEKRGLIELIPNSKEFVFWTYELGKLVENRNSILRSFQTHPKRTPSLWANLWEVGFVGQTFRRSGVNKSARRLAKKFVKLAKAWKSSLETAGRDFANPPEIEE
jgi:hypothetical protein